MLKHIQAAMAADSRLLIVEQVLDNPPNGHASALDVMMAVIGGKERTLEKFGEIAAQAGLRIVKSHETKGSDVAVIECAKL